MPARDPSPDTDRRLVALIVGQGLVEQGAIERLMGERTQRVTRGEPAPSLARLLCDAGLLDRDVAFALLKEVRREKTVREESGTRRVAASHGRKIGPYEILGEIGRGGMGSVYRAREPGGPEVALKVLHVSDPEDGASFEREQRLLGALGAIPGFVPLLASSTAPPEPYVVMPILGGGTLRERLRRGPLPLEEALALVHRLASALGRAHKRGIVHRDVKPTNVMFDGAGEAFLVDMGLAKHFRRDVHGAGQSASLSASGMIAGTIGCMAPEQMGDAKHAGPPADVFALGVILYECLSGRAPFSNFTLGTYERAVRSGRDRALLDLRALQPDVSPSLAALLGRALAFEPGERFPDGSALAHALQPLLGPGARSAPPPRGRVVVAGLVVAGLGLGLLLLTRSRTTPGARTPDAGLPPPVVRLEAPATIEADMPTARVALVSDRPLASLVANGTDLAPGPGPWTFELAVPPGGEAALEVRAADAAGRAARVAPVRVKRLDGGWDHERLPAGLRRASEKPLYVWAVASRLEIAMVRVPPGTFVMGSDAPEAFADEKPAHPHAMPAGFWIARTPTTWQDYRVFAAATARTLPESPVLFGKLDLARHPVVGVTWDDARAFCDWAGLSLPTEAQYEKAARGEHGETYPWGERWDPSRANHCDASCPPDTPLGDSTVEKKGFREPLGNDGFPYTSPVGSFAAGASPCGALDMVGNVWEWCEDWWDPEVYRRYAEGKLAPPESGKYRVRRGGSWNGSATFCRASARGASTPDDKGPGTGFRPVKTGP